jgi:hypothetical protein
LEIGPRLNGHSVIFLTIQPHPSCRILLAVDFPGLRRSGSWSQVIDWAQDFLNQASQHGDLGQLESDIATMTDDLGCNLDQLLS